VSALGKTLRSFRTVAGVTIDDAAIAAAILPGRVRRLERGHETLSYLEGLRLAKKYAICPNCFRRHVETALDRDGIAVEIVDPKRSDHADAPDSVSGHAHLGADGEGDIHE
jgi:hypothetical protein